MELLRTDRLVLRGWELEDAPAFFDIYGREEVSRWLGPHPRRAVADVAEAGERIRRWREFESGLQPPFGLWAVVELPASDPIGTALLLPLRDAEGTTDEVEVGWHLHPSHQGKGLASEAARALLDRAAAVGMSRVLALTDVDNVRSQAVAGRLGMSDEGTTDRWFGLTTRQFAMDVLA